jgi:hypothetical protein
MTPHPNPVIIMVDLQRIFSGLKNLYYCPARYYFHWNIWEKVIGLIMEVASLIGICIRIVLYGCEPL